MLSPNHPLRRGLDDANGRAGVSLCAMVALYVWDERRRQRNSRATPLGTPPMNLSQALELAARQDAADFAPRVASQPVSSR